MESTLNPTLDAHDTRILAELQKGSPRFQCNK
jgi:hypothetical protein